MNSSNFLIKPRAILVADASVVINLNATGRAHDIISALSCQCVVTENAFAELTDGMRNGHDDATRLHGLLEAGMVELVRLGSAGVSMYETLIDGSALLTLDDGEAATIAYAYEVGGIAVIDERKASKLCANRFPKLAITSTIRLLLQETVANALGHDGQIHAITSALQVARMRVPPDQICDVVRLIGPECAAGCKSLPSAEEQRHNFVTTSVAPEACWNSLRRSHLNVY